MPADRAVFEALLSGADVLLENFRAGVLARMGYDQARLRRTQPRAWSAVPSRVSARRGPMSDAPAYDQIIQGLSGMMSVTGTPDIGSAAGRLPRLRHHRRTGGRPGHQRGAAAPGAHRRGELSGRLDAGGLALGDGLGGLELPGQRSATRRRWATRTPPRRRRGPSRPRTVPSTSPPTGRTQFETLCRLVDHPDLIKDPRFAEREGRKDNRAALNPGAEQGPAARPAVEWETTAVRRRRAGRPRPDGAPGARAAAAGAPRVPHRAALSRRLGQARCGCCGNGVLIDGEAFRPTAPPPLLGQHNDEREKLAARWSAHLRRRGGTHDMTNTPQNERSRAVVGHRRQPHRAGLHRTARTARPGPHRTVGLRGDDLAAAPRRTPHGPSRPRCWRPLSWPVSTTDRRPPRSPPPAWPRPAASASTAPWPPA